MHNPLVSGALALLLALGAAPTVTAPAASAAHDTGRAVATVVEIAQAPTSLAESKLYAPLATTAKVVQVTTAALNVRTGPSTSYSSIGTAKNGERFSYHETKSGWHRITFGSMTGWVSGTYSKVITSTVTPKYTIAVTNCKDPFQAQSCVDSMTFSYIDYSPWGGPKWIGGHQAGKAKTILSFKTGDVIKVTGSAGAGVYRVTGDKWLPKKSGIKASSLGTGHVFQTCSTDGKQMRVVYASKIG